MQQLRFPLLQTLQCPMMQSLILFLALLDLAVATSLFSIQHVASRQNARACAYDFAVQESDKHA